MIGKYFRTDYFQKSKCFLFPLGSNQQFPTGTMKTYLMCDEIEEDIMEYNLIVKVNKDQEITDPLFLKNIVNIYEKDTFNVYVLDISEWKDDVEAFLAGSYSEFSEKGKKKVLKYFNGLKRGDKFYEDIEEIKGYHHIYVYFFPHKYKELVAKELCELHQLFNNVKEALKTISETKELCPLYNLEKETLKL